MSRRHSSAPQDGHLNITSLIDVLTILLVFLLKSYSAEPEGAITTSEVIQLPTSASSLKITEQITSVTITKEGILVDNKAEVAKIQDWAIVGTPEDNPFRIDGLISTLEEEAEKKRFIAERNPAFAFDGEIIIQADRSMPGRVLSAVLFSVGQAGFDKIRLLAINKFE